MVAQFRRRIPSIPDARCCISNLFGGAPFTNLVKDFPMTTATTCPTPDQQILLSRSDLRALGIRFSNSQLLRLEAVRRFPRRLRLSGASVCWDRDEILGWIDARKDERASWHYADPE